ncbi:hypothetical protein [Tumebacillus permanentifrigoris]|uniref:PH (Pleckstrin Homology) domain-containing protein n=1 Tax=Tumebacillus permanentifrigoris TaxID=378543 RepID=A0A316D296_9BACL|nr:hypothetical protein [Tumebacillus permanentifrigoris]PWK04987.1 hypothetical protein C7459_1301 [Tumebacillus permanentifrigoris]
MSIQPIVEGLPNDLRAQLMSQEVVYYFSYIAFKGGCGSSGSRSNYWIALTDKRVLYKSRIQEDNKATFVEKDGVLPLEKVSFMEVSEKSQGGVLLPPFDVRKLTVTFVQELT